jgi:hypothetical protein
MKKIITITMAVVFALALGLVYAGGSSAADRSWDNGITVLDAAPMSPLAHIDASVLDNGITIFALSAVGTGVNYKGESLERFEYEGSAAGGLEPRMDLGNGVTIFDEHAVKAD